MANISNFKFHNIFTNLSHNARIMMITEPLWAIPMSWYGIYLSIYMKEVGLSEPQIGWITFFTVIGQITGIFLGGFLADHWGRKKTLIVFDTICWGIPLVVWYLATGFWHFAIAGFFFGFGMIVIPSWLCLFTEEATPKQTQNGFSVMWFILAAGGLFSPIAGLLIKEWGMIPAFKILIIVGTFFIIIGILARLLYVKETGSSMASIKSVDLFSFRKNYKSHQEAIQWFWHQPVAKILLFSGFIYAYMTIMWSTFSPIYITDIKGLKFNESVVSFFPPISGLTICIIILFILPYIQKKSGFLILLMGVVLLFWGMVLFILSPSGILSYLFIYTFFYSGGIGLFNPTRDTLWLLALTEQKFRAKILAMTNLIALVVNLPIGPLGGYFYKLHPKLPFFFCISMTLFNFLLLYRYLTYRNTSNK